MNCLMYNGDKSLIFFMCQLLLSGSLPILLLAINRINSPCSWRQGMCAHFTCWQARAEDGAPHPPHSPTRVCPSRHTPHASPATCICSLRKADVPIQVFQHGEPGVPAHLRWQTHPSQELHIAQLHGSLPSSFYIQEGKSSSFPREEDVLPGLLFTALKLHVQH